MDAELPQSLDAGFELLDRQIVDVDDRPFANVDDLAFEYAADGRPYVAALLCGPGAWGARIGGRLGGWVLAVWRRLHEAADPQPAAIPMSAVARIDSSVHLRVPRDATAAGALERWVDAHVISRIPGSAHDG